MPGRYSPADSIRHQVFFSRSMCPALFGGLPSSLMFLLLHITKIFLWHLFSSCSVEFTAQAFHLTAPCSSSQCIWTSSSAEVHFYKVCIIPSAPPSPATAPVCTNCKAQVFPVTGRFSRPIISCAKALQEEEVGHEDMFSHQKEWSLLSKQKMFWARKLSCLAGNCWLCCSTWHHGSLTQKRRRKGLKPYQRGKDIFLVLLLKEHEHVREENSLDFCKRRSTPLQYNHTTHPRKDLQ